MSSQLLASAMDKPIRLKPPETEAELIVDLAPANSADVITSAIGKLEDMRGTNSIPALKRLLPDSRASVRRKAARVLGIFHAPMTDEEIAQACLLLKASDWREVVDGLKALRGFDAPQAVPEILPLLKYRQENVVRDSCRTLTVLGTKDVIPLIEPLLKDPNEAVRRDAQDAIAILRTKT
jgi:HEAT repeat protein